MEARKSVLIVSTNADLAGAPIHVYQLVRNLDQLGFEVAVVFGKPGPILWAVSELGVPTFSISSLKSKISPAGDLMALVKLLGITKNFRPDVIHCHSTKASMVARLVGLFSRTPVVYTVHGWGFGPGRRRAVSFIVGLIERGLVARTSQFIAVSDFDRDFGQRKLKIEDSKILTVRNGVPKLPRATLRNTETAIVVMVARDEYPKDFWTLAKALSKAQFDSAFFVGVGTDSPQFVRVMSEAAGGNSWKLSFEGESANVREYLDQASIFVLSSKFEGLPLSIVEAMERRLPVIATAVGGVPELVRNGENGFLFHSGDWRDLAQKITKLASNRSLREEMGTASRNLFEKYFDEATMVSETVRIYEKLISRP